MRLFVIRKSVDLLAISLIAVASLSLVANEKTTASISPQADSASIETDDTSIPESIPGAAGESRLNLSELPNQANSRQPATDKPVKLAIIMDDLGDNSVIAKQIVQLPNQLTLSVLPGTPQAHKIIDMAQRRGFELMMHLPMEAFSRPDLLGPGAIFQRMTDDQAVAIFERDIRLLPGITGFNNHMGSMLTENPEKMAVLMAVAKEKGLFFVDSRTSEQSVAEKIALQQGVAVSARDVFLDPQATGVSLEGQWQKALKIARRNGHAVVICHPYPATVEFLQNKLAQLSSEVQLVAVSELVSSRHLSSKQLLSEHLSTTEIKTAKRK